MPQLSFPSYLTEGAPAAGSSQVALVVENPPANAGGIGDLGLIPGPGRSPGGGHGNPLQYSCLENPRAREAWRATVRRVTQSRTRLSDLAAAAAVQLYGDEKCSPLQYSCLENPMDGGAWWAAVHRVAQSWT